MLLFFMYVQEINGIIGNSIGDEDEDEILAELAELEKEDEIGENLPDLPIPPTHDVGVVDKNDDAGGSSFLN